VQKLSWPCRAWTEGLSSRCRKSNA